MTALSEQQLWHRLVEAESDGEFCQSWLGLQCQMIGGVDSGLVVAGNPGEDAFGPVAFWPANLRNASHLSAITERVLNLHKAMVIRSDAATEKCPGEEPRLHIGYPVKIRGQVHGAASLELRFRSQDQLQAAMRQLQWGIAWLENRIMRKQAEPEAQIRDRLATALDLAATALQEEKFPDAAVTVVTVLATRFECNRVSIGFLENRQAKVHALSHAAQFNKKMNLVRCIGAAMDESMDQQRTITYPGISREGTPILRAHTELALQNGGDAICTIPFVGKDGKACGAMLMERSPDVGFSPAAVILFEAVAALTGPILEEKRKADQSIRAKIRSSFRAKIEEFAGPGHIVQKLVAVAAVALIVFFSFAVGDYRITSGCMIEGAIKRSIVAPFNGYISEAPVRAGDIVRVDQLMCSLDDRDMRIERLKWASQKEQHYLESLEAMDKGDTAKSRIAREQMNQAAAQFELLEEQLSRAKILAPFDAVVVTGDLSQSLAAPVERGQVLFEIAPLDSYRVKLEVGETSIDDIKVGQSGELVLTAFPEKSFPFWVEKITPVSKPREGANYFIVEAGLQNITENLLPGMEGFGKIDVDRRKLVWIWTHELIDWVRLTSWSWMP
ncbi:MAG: HlyD family efflux transporter periplasmic adaptor subunit [Desulfobacteraceae bacterium]|nr:HlyD family efflux transporter periplasmic adaptor subunit [Desulfobacteraceae bacterium]